MKLGQTLRTARLSAKKSMVGIAKELGYTNCALVQQIEKETRHIPKGRIADWATAYNLSTDLLDRLNKLPRARRVLTGVDDFNLMTILPFVMEAKITKLTIGDLARTALFAQSLDIPINRGVIIGYLSGLMNQ